eukprot:696266-Pleurochrysis_carterae.AAC.1
MRCAKRAEIHHVSGIEALASSLASAARAYRRRRLACSNGPNGLVTLASKGEATDGCMERVHATSGQELREGRLEKCERKCAGCAHLGTVCGPTAFDQILLVVVLRTRNPNENACTCPDARLGTAIEAVGMRTVLSAHVEADHARVASQA